RRFLKIINDHLLKLSFWHFLLIGIVLSEILTFSLSTISGYILWGRISRETLIIGMIDSFAVPFVVATIMQTYVAEVSRLRQELKSRKEKEIEIKEMAYFDSLTSLPNRVFFKDLLARAIAHGDRHNMIVGVLFIDLDLFKHINDTLGHHFGDRVLQAVSDRLLKVIRMSDYMSRSQWESEWEKPMDIVSRLGGDEFILLLHTLLTDQDAAKVAHRMLQELSEPFNLDGREIFITASIGISLYPKDGADAEELLKNADIAMYHAKSQGRNNFQYYAPGMTTAALRHITLENNLRKALQKDEFSLHYQPIYSTNDTRRVIGVEALLRWKYADPEMSRPSVFIPVAEESGLILPIGEWVLRQACKQNKVWQDAGLDPVIISVNLSSRQFDQPDLLNVVSRALNTAGLSPQYLELEITESAIMRNPEDAIKMLHGLKALGVRIAIDDFGTGYSSLAYLRRIPLDYLKIDRSFVANIELNRSDETIIRAITAMAHSLDLKVIAEGVENEDQLRFLQGCKCEAVQGFFFSRPVPAEVATEVLAQNAYGELADSGDLPKRFFPARRSA
ncbi:MAG TPA: EAL domain-containing protein, partial [Dissulfurispiraceae bacterium]|nr:EAL domain-containing protein [Dissulfurispiraceae bacterium]